MATKIPLHERRELPPSRVGIAKPSFELVDMSGQRRFWQKVGEWGAGITDKALKTRVSNEKHEYMGIVETALQNYENRIKEKPGASFEEMEKWWGEAEKEMEAGGQGLTTQEGKEYAKNDILANKELRKAQGVAIRDAQVLRHEQTKFNILRQNYIESGTPEELADLYEEHKGTLIEEEVADLMLEQDLAEQERLRKKQNLDAIFDMAKAMPLEERIAFINDLPGLERADRNDLIARIKRQNEIETASHNGKVYWDLERKVKENPEKYPDDVIESYVKPNSITWEDAEKLRDLRDKPPTDPLKSSTYKTYSGILDALYPAITSPKEFVRQHGVEEFKKKTTSELIQEYEQKHRELEQFAVQNPAVTATSKQWREFFDELTKKEREEITLGWLERILLPKRAPAWIGSEQRLLTKRRIQALKEEGVWETLNEAEQESARERFMRGETVQDILDLLK